MRVGRPPGCGNSMFIQWRKSYFSASRSFRCRGHAARSWTDPSAPPATKAKFRYSGKPPGKPAMVRYRYPPTLASAPYPAVTSLQPPLRSPPLLRSPLTHSHVAPSHALSPQADLAQGTRAITVIRPLQARCPCAAQSSSCSGCCSARTRRSFRRAARCARLHHKATTTTAATAVNRNSSRCRSVEVQPVKVVPQRCAS